MKSGLYKEQSILKVAFLAFLAFAKCCLIFYNALPFHIDILAVPELNFHDYAVCNFADDVGSKFVEI